MKKSTFQIQMPNVSMTYVTLNTNLQR